MRVWIDTDIGSDVDDALALAYVLNRPEFDLVGVSTVFGDLEVRGAVARRLLALGGAPAVPVVEGLGVPLTPGKPGRMFGHEGRGLLDPVTPRRRVTEQPDREDRVEALAAALQAAAPDVLLAIGPLTNLAALARAGVDLPPLAVMGGRFTADVLSGMPDGLAEWNWFCDPEAVRTVLAARHSRPPLVVPADVTFRTAFETGDLDVLAAAGALGATLSRLCHHWLEAQRDTLRHEFPRVYLHDPLTAAVLVEPSLCRFDDLAIRTDPTGAATVGGPDTSVVRAAVDVDPEAVRAHLLASLTGAGTV